MLHQNLVIRNDKQIHETTLFLHQLNGKDSEKYTYKMPTTDFWSFVIMKAISIKTGAYQVDLNLISQTT